MYSLYQAWLLRENSSLSSSTMVTIPDTIINVGTGDSMQKYSGHKIILSSQSGYLRSLLSTQEAAPEIYITNVNAEIFGILLTFMYTGYLNINSENIYSVLLATHLLHMPRALDLCRSFLIEQQTIPTLLPLAPLAPTLPTNIIKPIPSRKLLPTIIQQQKNQAHLEKSYWDMNSSVFQPVQSKIIEPKESIPLTINTQQPSTSKEINQTTSVSSLSPCLSNISGTSDELTVTITERNDENPKKKMKIKHSKNNEENNKVIIDIASCDGPVRFQRVLNINYRAKTQDPATGDDENSGQNFNNDKSSEPVVKEKPFHALSFLNSKELEMQAEEVFKCDYCDHTFKSKYCFQKHTKRHLNSDQVGGDVTRHYLNSVKVGSDVAKRHPNSLEVGDDVKFKSVTQPPPMRLQSSTKKSQASQSTVSKREVRLLDMNVQYYPCKTCGSKFPSYYFVHKHRKICHPEEENALSDHPSTESAPKTENNSSNTDQSKGLKTD